METRTTTTDNDRVGLETTCVPLPNGSDGRDSHGRFCKGNRGGPGNPIAQQVSQIRRVLLSAVTEEDLVASPRPFRLESYTSSVPTASFIVKPITYPSTSSVDEPT